MGDRRDLGFLFNPKSIAVVGATDAPGRLSRIIMESLTLGGFPGAVYPVNPKYKEVMGMRCYPSLRSVGAEIDLAVMAVPAPLTVDIFKNARGGLRAAVVISGGFSETGPGGKAMEDELRGVAEKEGIRVVGPNCMGLYDTVSRVDTLFISRERVRRPRPGAIAILSQSGSFALTAMDEFSSLGIGVSRVVSYGNRMDVNEADCLDFLAEDASTGAVVLYIEGIEDGGRFVEAASRCAREKTVMAMKVGKGRAGGSAARSHTGAMAGRYEVYRAAFKKAGVIEVAGYEEFMDGCRALNRLPRSRGVRIMIITDGGGMGAAIADACEAAGLEVPMLPEEKRAPLLRLFPSYFTVANPLDLTGSVTDEWMRGALSETLKGDSYDLAIVAALWGPPGLTDAMPGMLSAVAKASGKPVVICSPGGDYTKAKKPLFEKEGFAVFDTPEAAVRAARVLAGRQRARYG
ncbi:MAG: CoA-binding protein [Deltaproteobacteria bacterium]|nr:CoA-binding protein [Deltaproteobacteria bacterium]